MPLGSKLADETEDDTASYLPESAESTEVVNILDREFAAGETTIGLIVYQREGGLTAADRRVIAAQAAEIEAGRQAGPADPAAGGPVRPGRSRGPRLARRRRRLHRPHGARPTSTSRRTGARRSATSPASGADGMRILLTGDLGFATDAEEVFGDLDAKLLAATVLLVLVLLGLIYRAVLVALTPLLVVFFSYTVATAFVYLYAESGASVSSNGTTILVVLMFGVGTDYSLLLVSRYREELRRIEDKHEAMGHALRRTGPTILASGLTVALAMLVLALADTRLTSSLGPVSAIGVACAMVAGLTLLPALLTIFGRTGFWPRRATVEYDPEHPETARQGLWRRFGDKVLERPLPALIVTVLLFAVGALGLAAYKVDYSTTNFFKESVDSVEGFEVLGESFPAGHPGADDGAGRAQRRAGHARGRRRGPCDELERRGRRRAGDPDRAQVRRTAARLDRRDPRGRSLQGVDPRRRAADPRQRRRPRPGAAAPWSAAEARSSTTTTRRSRSDLKLIVPIALLVIAIILALLLWSLVAPLVLIASVILSFFCTLGLSMLFIRFVVGDPGFDASLPTFAFIFLVALGIDYTIFLMARVREESRRHGTREGMLRALSATGPVITSAGIILAGTFSVLMTLPVTYTFDLGFMVALGILLDTFIVRTIMVPAAVELIGDKIWWPSTADRGGALREKSAAEAEAEVVSARP